MNELLSLLGIEPWKAVLSALVLPPVPFIASTLIGAKLIARQRGLGWLVILFSVTGLWLGACTGSAHLLIQFGLDAPQALTSKAIKEIKAESLSTQKVAIVVLGGGVQALAPEYDTANLSPTSVERLRYGLWLQRETGAPVAFSGGVGWAQSDSPAEAQVASQIAIRDFGRSIKWLEDRSRDTRENASRTVAMLKKDGVKHIVLVTNGWHMRRAKLLFEQKAPGTMSIQAAPMGLTSQSSSSTLDWLPTTDGFMLVNQALHEILGILVGA